MTKWIWHRAPREQAPPNWNSRVRPAQTSRVEYLYAWERRCRGYDLFSGPVRLEPLFIPYGEILMTAADDPAFLLCALSFPTALTYLPLRLPTAQKVTAPLCSSFLSGLSSVVSPLAFEIIGSHQEVAYQLAVSADDVAEVRTHLNVHFPLAETADGEDSLQQHLAPLKSLPLGYQVIDFGLYHPVYMPLQQFSSFTLDPLSGLVGVLAHLGPQEVAGLQVLFTPAQSNWLQSLERVVAEFDGGQPARESDLHKQARQKLAGSLWACVIRVFAVSAEGDARAFGLCQRLGRALASLSGAGTNSLIALDNRGYDDETHFLGLVERSSHRPGMLLSTAELMGLVHPPLEKLHVAKLRRSGESERSLPEHLVREPGAAMGLHQYRGIEQRVVWPDAFRTRHCYLLGATRMGKSTLLLNLIAQDIKAGKGLCVIDPHGDLAQDVLALVPPERAGDTLYLDLSDTEYPVAMGLLEAHSEWEQRLVASDVLSILKRLFTSSWGDRLEHILRHVLLTLIVEPGHTLRDIRLLLSDEAYREGVCQAITNPDLLAFWHSEFPGYTQSAFAPIYNKLGLLLSSPLVRNIVAQPQSRLNISQIITEKNILVVNLAQSLIGEDNAYFLGALLVSKIQIAAMHGLKQDRDQRTPFTLYVDEFQNFVVSSFEKILSEAGKAGLSLVMANQFLEQLTPALQAAILGNVGTMVSFRVSSESARYLEKEFAKLFTADDIVSLSRGKAIVRLGQASDSFRIHTLPPPEKAAVRVNQEVLERTHRLCCRPRAEIEAEIAQEHGGQSPTGDGKAAAHGARDSGLSSVAAKAAATGYLRIGQAAAQTDGKGLSSAAAGLSEPAVFSLTEEEMEKEPDTQMPADRRV